MREEKVYYTEDGKMFKTKKSAEKHEKALYIKSQLEILDISEEELSVKIEKLIERNVVLRMKMKDKKIWKDLPLHDIQAIFRILEKAESTQLITKYMLVRNGWSSPVLIATETGDDYGEINLHSKGEYPWMELESLREEEENSYTKIFFLKEKFSIGEKAEMKFKANAKLESDEIRQLLECSELIYEEEGENRRWSRSKISVIDLDGMKVAIEWEEGLTEAQEDEFYTQPYEVEILKEEVVVTRTTIKKK